MSWFTKMRNLLKMVQAFRDCGLINAWHMAMQTNEMIREVVAVPYPVEADAVPYPIELIHDQEEELSVIDGEILPYSYPYLLSAPKDE